MRTAAVERIMGEDEGRGRSTAQLLAEHGAAIARVCMALLGDAREVERALEQVAREVATRGVPEANTRAWIFGLARAACATRMSRVPLRGNTTGPRLPDDSPNTERLGARDAVPARGRLGSLKPTEREAVVLHAVGGLDAAEVAVACGVEVSTARTRIAQAMSKLAEGGSR